MYGTKTSKQKDYETKSQCKKRTNEEKMRNNTEYKKFELSNTLPSFTLIFCTLFPRLKMRHLVFRF